MNLPSHRLSPASAMRKISLTLPGNDSHSLPSVDIETDDMVLLYIQRSTYNMGRALGTPILTLGIITNLFFLRQIFRGGRIFYPIYQVQLCLTLINLISIMDFLIYQNFFLAHHKVDKGAYCIFNLVWNFMFRYSYYTIEAANAYSCYKLLCADHVLPKTHKIKIVRGTLLIALLSSLVISIMSAYFLVDFDGSNATLFKFGSLYLFCRKRIEVHLYDVSNFFNVAENLADRSWSSILKFVLQTLSLFGPVVFINTLHMIAIYKFYKYMKNYISNMTRCFSKNERRRRLILNAASFKGLVAMFILNKAADFSGLLAAEWKPENVLDNSTLSYLPMHFINWILAPLAFFRNFQDKTDETDLLNWLKPKINRKIHPLVQTEMVLMKKYPQSPDIFLTQGTERKKSEAIVKKL